MGNGLPILAVLCALGGLGFVLAQRAPKEERIYLQVSLVAHVVACLLRLWWADVQFGGSDADGFAMHAQPIVELMSSEPLEWLDDVIYFTIGLPHHLPLSLGPQTSTGSMIGVAAFGLFFAGGSLPAVHLALTILGFFAKWLLYLGMGKMLPRSTHKQLLFATVLMPSVVFWTTGLIKETLTLVGLALFISGLASLQGGRWRAASVLHGTIMVVGVGIVALFKPFFLFPLGAATAAFLAYSGERQGRFRMTPMRWAMATALGIGVIAGVSELFPRFSPAQIADTAATMQRLGATQAEYSGSTFVLADSAGDRSTRTQLLLAPLGVLTSLTRPFLFESRNMPMLIAALEMTVLTIVLAVAAYRLGMDGVRRFVTSHPALLFCAVFVVIAAAGVGVATTNFGTLSRYRVPFMPFYTTLLLLGYDATRRVAPARRPIGPPPRRPAQPALAPRRVDTVPPTTKKAPLR